MPTIKKENINDATTIYILRNVKGNELRVSDLGARIISFRFRDSSFKNQFVLNNGSKENILSNTQSGAVFVDSSDKFTNEIWNAEETLEGVKFTIERDNTQVSVIYSLSNDNEVSIKTEATGAKDVTVKVPFNGEIFGDAKFKIYSEENISTYRGNWKLIDKPAVVEMELGMFGFDIGCPIDWIGSGLKNAVDIKSDSTKILAKVYVTQERLQIEDMESGFEIETSGATNGQMVYVFKNEG